MGCSSSKPKAAEPPVKEDFESIPVAIPSSNIVFVAGDVCDEVMYEKPSAPTQETPSSLLVPPSSMVGKCVAISSVYVNFVVIMKPDGSVNVNHHLPLQNLQPGNNWERFLVVSCGLDQVAFYSTCHKRFLRMEGDGAVNGYGGQIDNEDQLPTDWHCERFQLIPEDEGRRFLIYSPFAKRFLRILYPEDTVDGKGGVVEDPSTIPPLDVWGAERLILTNHPSPTQETPVKEDFHETPTQSTTVAIPSSNIVVSVAGDICGGGTGKEFKENLLNDGTEPWNKWLHYGHIGSSFIEYTFSQNYEVSEYGLCSANDCPDRDPTAWHVEGLEAATGIWHLLHESNSDALFTDRWQWKWFSLREKKAVSRIRLAITGVRNMVDGIQLGHFHVRASVSTPFACNQ